MKCSGLHCLVIHQNPTLNFSTVSILFCSISLVIHFVCNCNSCTMACCFLQISLPCRHCFPAHAAWLLSSEHLNMKQWLRLFPSASFVQPTQSSGLKNHGSRTFGDVFLPVLITLHVRYITNVLVLVPCLIFVTCYLQHSLFAVFSFFLHVLLKGPMEIFFLLQPCHPFAFQTLNLCPQIQSTRLPKVRPNTCQNSHWESP